MNSSYDLNLHRVIGRGGAVTPSGWQRPSEWPALPVPASNEIYALFAIDKSTTDNDGIPVALRITCPSGTFTIDWGDGTIDSTLSSGNAFAHIYVPSNTTGVTDTSYGYKVAVVKITATTDITIADFVETISPQVNIQRGSGWLSIDINCPSLSGAGNPMGNSSRQSALGSLVEFNLRASSLTSTILANYFQNLECLEKIHNINTSGTITSLSNTFNGCSSLVEIPMFNTASVTTFEAAFLGCSSLVEIPLLDTSSVTNFSQAFQSCTDLTTIPLLDTSSVTNFTSCFAGCSKLKTIPLIDTSAATNVIGMFNGCSALRNLPNLVFTAVTGSCNSLFNNCYNLQAIPTLSLSSISSHTNIITNCYSLKRCLISKYAVAALNLNANYLLGREALVEIFNALPTGSATITITNTRGALTVDAGERAIATGKGWTIVG